MRRRQVRVDGLERLFRLAIPPSCARHDAPPLRLDENPAFGAFARADLATRVVVRAQEPLAVPAVSQDRSAGPVRSVLIVPGLGSVPAPEGDGGEFRGG